MLVSPIVPDENPGFKRSVGKVKTYLSFLARRGLRLLSSFAVSQERSALVANLLVDNGE
jgi:hypothetical protein